MSYKYARRKKVREHTMDTLSGKLKELFSFLGGIKDHTGKEYGTIEEMCESYNITYFDFYTRITSKYRNWTLEEALTIPVIEQKVCVDHKGQQFKSERAMCATYGISRDSFHNRLKNGWSLEKALTTPGRKTNRKKVTDHLGKVYESITAMCAIYGISDSTYAGRIQRGWSKEAALTTPTYNKDVDENGVVYSSRKALAEKLEMTVSSVNHYRRQGISVEDCKRLNKYDRAPVKRLIEIGEIKPVKKHALANEVIRYLDRHKLNYVENAKIGDFFESEYSTLDEKVLSFAVHDNKSFKCVIAIDTTEHFWPTLFTGGKKQFIERVYDDILVQTFLEEEKCPLIRIRYDQQGNIFSILDYAFKDLKECVKNHNKYLSNEEYWLPRHDFNEFTMKASSKSLDDLPPSVAESIKNSKRKSR